MAAADPTGDGGEARRRLQLWWIRPAAADRDLEPVDLPPAAGALPPSSPRVLPGAPPRSPATLSPGPGASQRRQGKRRNGEEGLGSGSSRRRRRVQHSCELQRVRRGERSAGTTVGGGGDGGGGSEAKGAGELDLESDLSPGDGRREAVYLETA